MTAQRPGEPGQTEPGAKRWTLGLRSGGGVLWQSFATEDAALKKYDLARASKVLFCPDRNPIRCSTPWHDSKGVGVAAILMAQRGECHQAMDTTAVLEAIRAGKVPFVPPERLPVVRWLTQAAVQLTFGRSSVTFFSAGPYRRHSLCYFDQADCPGVQGHVALSIDDAPCRLGRGNSMLPQVRALLREHGARATFMVVGGYVEGHEEDLAGLLADGHELGNHCMLDRAYHDDRAEDFDSAVQECSERIRALQRQAGVAEGVRWFRAPHGRYTEAMAEVLARRGLTNVMCDTYACCPVIQDAEFIGSALARRADHGSILLVHAPEVGLREWCLPGLERLLRGLEARGLKAVTVSELAARAGGSAPPAKD